MLSNIVNTEGIWHTFGTHSTFKRKTSKKNYLIFHFDKFID